MFGAVRQACQDYYHALPNEIVTTVAKSAFYSFTISLLFIDKKASIDLTRPLIKAGVAALASTIHALMTPVFNKIFGNKELNSVHEFVKSGITAVLASTAMALATTSRVDLVAFNLYHLISSNSFIAFFSSSPKSPTTGQPLPKPFIQENSIYFCL